MPVQANGLVDLDMLRDAITDKTILITLMYANNEIGVIQPVAEIGKIARERGVLFHSDAVQAVGKVPVNVLKDNIDIMSLTGHKLYGPKGVGALYVRRGVELSPLLLGAGQERGRRPGTENVAFIVALGEACRIASVMLESEQRRLFNLADELFAGLEREIPGVVLVGRRSQRLPNTVNALFPKVSGRQLLENCPRVMASTGSACHADNEDPSAVLTALGIPHDQALGAVRLSLEHRRLGERNH